MAEPGGAPRDGVLRDFLLACLLWLPTAFLAWYWLAPAIQIGAWVVSEAVRRAFLAGLVTAIEIDGRTFEVVTGLAAPGSGPEGVITFMVDPLLYSCGMPLFVGLTLASSGSFGAMVVRVAAGLAALVPVQAFGVLMDILKTLAFDLAGRAGVTVAWGGHAREAIALGFQLGSLVLPGVAALLAWGLLNRGFVLELTRREAAAPRG